MNLTLAYRGRSAVVRSPSGMAVTLEPNLRRDRVGYEGVLRRPIRFREAIGALHDVVVSDLRHRPRDDSAYQDYLESERRREEALRRVVVKEARQAIREGLPELPEPDSARLEKDYERLRKRYWDARLKYSDYLSRHDPEVWRLLVPCDPVITVAPDVLFFECFSADESSYGCLTVGRDAFAAEHDAALGTTNVDYSWSLYEHFQKLRSYRETRFLVDPSGFEVRHEGDPAYREEKIDLPPSWLRGFLQLQSAMSLPMRRVPVSREGLYSVLAFLKRHRAKKSPRAVRFELEPGRPAQIVLEPWERRIALHGEPYEGRRPETIRVWGRDRLRLLARLLPLMEGADVYLLGTGLPSFWSVRMGEMRLMLGLSGWTANDWTGATALDQIAPPRRAERRPPGRHRRLLPRVALADLRADPPSHRRLPGPRRRRPEPAGPARPVDPRPPRRPLPLAIDPADGPLARADRPRGPGDGRRAGPRLRAEGPRRPRRPPPRRPPPARRPRRRASRLAPARRRRPDAPRPVYLLPPLPRRPPDGAVPPPPGPPRHRDGRRRLVEPGVVVRFDAGRAARGPAGRGRHALLMKILEHGVRLTRDNDGFRGILPDLHVDNPPRGRES